MAALTAADGDSFLTLQEKGRLEIKVTTLGEENRKLQHNILQLEKQRKDTESQNVAVNSKAAKVREGLHNCANAGHRQALSPTYTEWFSTVIPSAVRGGHCLLAT